MLHPAFAEGDSPAPQTQTQSAPSAQAAPAAGDSPPAPQTRSLRRRERRNPLRPRGVPTRDPKAAQILQEVLQAYGGEDYLRSVRSLFIRTRQWRGEGDQVEEILVTQYWKEPNLYRHEVENSRGTRIMAYNGRYGWNDLGQGVTIAPRSMNRHIEDLVRDINEPLSHLDEGNSLEYVGASELDGQAVDVVRVTRSSGKIKILHIDRDSRRVLMKEVAKYREPDVIIARRRFLDFRQVDQTWVAFVEEDLTGEVPHRVEVVDFIPNQAIDDRLFDSPLPLFEETPPLR